ncbi:MAG: outer membrane beta-barrel protein [Bacteroidota bacterium]
MPEPNFDDIIRRKLLDFHPPSSHEEWGEMDSMLNSFEHNFDQLFRHKLTAHEVSYQQADWALMESQLHGVFDASIKSVLEGYSASFQTADWHAFQEILDEPFYHTLKQKLHSYSIPYKTGEWRRMLTYLRGDAIVKPWYTDWRKTMAAAAIALICVAAWGFTKLERSPRLPDLAINEITLPELASTSLSDEQGTGIENAVAEETSEVISSPFYQPEVVSSPEELTAITLAEANMTADNMLAQDNLSENELGTSLVPDWASSEVGYQEKESLPALSSLQYDELKLAYPSLPSLGDKVATTVGDKLLFDPEVKIGWVSGTADSRAELNEAGRGGFITGIRAELALNDELSVVSGILYAQKVYFHQRGIFTANRTPATLELSGEFQTVEVPILVRFTFPSQNKFNLYLQGGAVTMVTLKEDYITESIVESAARNRQAVPSERSYNTYLGNLQAAIGVSYEVTPDLDLQLEPYFQWGLQKMGREGKKIYSSGLMVSFMYNLKKKAPPKL